MRVQETEPPIPNDAAKAWNSRHDRLKRELAFALKHADSEDLKQWAIGAAGTFGTAAKRRIATLAGTVAKFSKGAYQEIVGLLRAFGKGHAKDHFVAMADRAAVTATELKDAASASFNQVSTAIERDPSRGAMTILGAALGFVAGSGGTDANGGAPDTDIQLMGIEAHRSIFTHSILIGVTIETSVLSLIDLNRRVHSKLPRGYDVFWDKLLESSDQIANAFARGASGGVAYHLFVDATLQPGAYHDLGVAMPMEAHQAILLTNSIAEGLDAARREGVAYRPRTGAGETVEKGIKVGKVASEQTVLAAQVAGSYVIGFLKGFFRK